MKITDLYKLIGLLQKQTKKTTLHFQIYEDGSGFLSDDKNSDTCIFDFDDYDDMLEKIHNQLNSTTIMSIEQKLQKMIE